MQSNGYKIAVLEGDAIGPEIMQQAVRVFDLLSQHRDVRFTLMPAKFGAGAYFDTGKAFPDETKAICDEADAILKGPVGLSYEEAQKIPVAEQPERGAILPLRARYNTYANFRPILLSRDMAHFSPLKPEIIKDGIDILLIRELVGGLYFGAKERGTNKDGLRYVKETLEYDEDQIRAILQVAFEQAQKRKKVLHNIHKSNVLISSVFWNEVLQEVQQDYPQVTVIHLLVDAAATALCLNPGQFDVMVMENMFGDILSDQGGGILGSLGLMPSACIGPEKAYYEPSHGSAPDIAGQNIANPYSMIGSVAMMLEMSFNMTEEAAAVWQSMQGVFEDGYSTADLSSAQRSVEILTTDAFGDRVMAKLDALLS
ncbi:MAG: 3-isopropylmalate dehydrogenase [Pseudomonadales bacterium]|jgi:3-isopropylmalate dehydrogenase|nr:3-isopropylmalate dehydrogenase [Pseudomonadales bacterium]MDP7358236.1 3-isopropylmalate dehydrogenase [Pseudomonadales bacterium]MDP7597717.1 3-isopropylmalate dehydrogenase [Pseudomonadales bacterium]HJN49036.1 3-isopropylmalate dehydrogenase [Pseudomonadales bacterium]|tara:strand:+ start:3051 stop:4160 length:1110 start_codon:yes stop_codon:yes gene_type:complete